MQSRLFPTHPNGVWQKATCPLLSDRNIELTAIYSLVSSSCHPCDEMTALGEYGVVCDGRVSDLEYVVPTHPLVCKN